MELITYNLRIPGISSHEPLTAQSKSIPVTSFVKGVAREKRPRQSIDPPDIGLLYGPFYSRRVRPQFAFTVSHDCADRAT
jgi:hypothetical protein